MSRILDNDQLRVGPGTVQFPGGLQRPTHVESTMDEGTGDASQPAGLAQQYAFLQPRTVGEVVRADPHEGQSGSRTAVAIRVGGAAGFSGQDRVLPGAP